VSRWYDGGGADPLWKKMLNIKRSVEAWFF